ncbi:50S ribosomal protein L10 [Demequina flava]|uniref:50S ribosomal protein L10 n=1 Tax=Demequina flava TaxID=1095025 RepID=UPI000781CFE5|nr:50S ribosomal protein L10 [Demequina flava]
MATPDKVAAVEEITARFREANAVVVTEYRGLSVPQLAELRGKLSGAATYRVAKNTLTALAAKEAGVEGIDDLFVGPTAIAFITGDPVEAAKALKEFSKANEALVIKGGVLEGNAISAELINKLADLESREVLLAKAAGAMQASLVNAAYMFQAPLSKAARAADALRAKQEDAA